MEPTKVDVSPILYILLMIAVFVLSL